MSRRVRIPSLLAGVVALVGAACGITYAATTAATSHPSSTYAKACTTATHSLRLVSSGKCPKGDSPITLGAAPTPLAVNGSRATKKTTVGAFTFSATCSDDMGGQHANLAITSTRGYVVQGTDVLVDNNSGGFRTPAGPAANGAGQITFAASKGELTSNLNLDNDAGVTGNLVVIQSGHTIALTFALFAYSVDCSVQAQIAPSD